MKQHGILRLTPEVAEGAEPLVGAAGGPPAIAAILGNSPAMVALRRDIEDAGKDIYRRDRPAHRREQRR